MSGPAALFGFNPDWEKFFRAFLYGLKGSIWGILGEASFMGHAQGIVGRDLRRLIWRLFSHCSIEVFFLLWFSSIPLLFSDRTPCVPLILELGWVKLMGLKILISLSLFDSIRGVAEQWSICNNEYAVQRIFNSQYAPMLWKLRCGLIHNFWKSWNIFILLLFVVM